MHRNSAEQLNLVGHEQTTLKKQVDSRNSPEREDDQREVKLDVASRTGTCQPGSKHVAYTSERSRVQTRHTPNSGGRRAVMSNDRSKLQDV